MKIAAHRLLIKNPEATLDFYQNLLSMTLIDIHKVSGQTHYYLSLGSQQAALELIHRPEVRLTVSPQPSATEGYWKFTVAVDDLDTTRSKLVEKGVRIGECFEVKGLAYLCHLTDPNGYCIELIQKTLQITGSEEVPLHPGLKALNLSTLRVKNIESSLSFYKSVGMKLVYTYRSDERKMTLFFLVSEDYVEDLRIPSDATQEERLWQSAYTLLELQHIDNTENNPDFHYRVGPETGFLGLDLLCDSDRYSQLSNKFPSRQCVQNRGEFTELFDPDGYKIRVMSAMAFCS